MKKQKAKNDFLEYVLHDAMQEIRGVTARGMFGGYGVYRDGVIFAIIVEDELYFKVDEKNLPEYKERGSEAFTYRAKNNKKVSMSYWKLPAEILEDRELLAEWVDASVAVSRRKTKKIQT